MNTLLPAEPNLGRRYKALLWLLALLALSVVCRLVYLHIWQHDFLLDQGAKRSVRTQSIPAFRGLISDRRGEPVAISTPVKTAWLNPQTFNLQAPGVASLLRMVNLTQQQLSQKLQQHKDREFMYLKRHIPPAVGAQIAALQLPGCHLMNEFRRYYPGAEINAHLLGFTNIDHVGSEGLELVFDNWLHGRSGKRQVRRDRLGRGVESVKAIANSRAGRDLTLSMDQRLQFVAHRALQQAITTHQARSGSVVVLDVETGEVLAMVNQPTYNPNQPYRFSETGAHRNRAVTDTFEPGSVMKPFSLAAVFEGSRSITANTRVNTAPGRLALRGGVVRDLANYGTLSVADIMKHSSNVGITKLTQHVSSHALWETYRRFGFGELTGSGFPGERTGVVKVPGPKQSFVHATMAFGYGLTVTPLQLARAFAILGAGGVKRSVTFVKQSQPSLGTRVMQAQIARQILSVMQQTVEHPASNARVPGYQVAGKTGTARQVGRDGYERGRHRAVFGGVAPAGNPKFAIVVAINDPQAGRYYSNQVAAPVFAQVASGALRLYNIQPESTGGSQLQIAQNGNRHT